MARVEDFVSEQPPDRYGLAEHLRVGSWIETHQEPLPFAECWGAEVAGWSHQDRQEVVTVGLVFRQIEAYHFLALGGDDL